jgi:hypothetical protein
MQMFGMFDTTKKSFEIAVLITAGCSLERSRISLSRLSQPARQPA